MNWPKRRRVTNQTGADGATTSNDLQEILQPSPPLYLTLTAECWKHIFDYLQLKDIIVMGQTCMRLNQMAGNYIHEYHPDLDFGLIESLISFENICIQPDFYRYIGKLSIEPNDDFKSFSNVEKFDSLKAINFHRHTFNQIKIINMQNVLKNIEVIHLTDCDFGRNMFALLMSHCPNLKYLNVIQYSKAENAGLFKHYCPTLERLDYLFGRYTNACNKLNKLNDELKIFLEKHTQLKQIEIDYGLFWINRDVLSQSNIQLDLLHLFVSASFTKTEFDEFIRFLKTLHRRSFYKTLKLSLNYGFNFDNVEYLSKTISTLPGLEKLMTVVNSFIDLTCLSNLRELHCDSYENMELLAKNLPKLERLTLKFVYNNEILPFIQHSKNLKTIEIMNLSSDNDNVFDLFELNEQRNKLENATEVVICVQEKEYL